MPRALFLITAVTLAAGLVGLAAVTPARAVDPAAGGSYVGLTPQRALDTREPGSGGPLGPGSSRRLALPGVVPASATAVVLNLTVAAPTVAGYLTVYRADAATRPPTSSLNFRAGEIRSNDLTVALPTSAGAAKAVEVYNFAGSSQVVVDVLGYYDPATTSAGGSTYVPAATPFRVADTRDGGTPLRSGSSLPVAVASPGIAGVTDVAVNVTAVDPSGQGFLTAFRGTGTKPATSTVNYGTDPVTPNFAIVPVAQATDGSLRFQVDNSGARVDVVVDVVGYYARDDTRGLVYAAIAPQRVFDSRDGAVPLGDDTAGDIPIPDYRGAVAIALNVTAVDATVPTYLTVYRAGLTSPPAASNLNPFTSFALANAVQTEVTSSAPDTVSFSVYNLRGSVDVVADLQGYFIPLD